MFPVITKYAEGTLLFKKGGEIIFIIDHPYDFSITGDEYQIFHGKEEIDEFLSDVGFDLDDPTESHSPNEIYGDYEIYFFEA